MHFQGRGGEIKHLYRNFAFLYSRMYLDNGGIFVCKTRHLLLAGGAKVISGIDKVNFIIVIMMFRSWKLMFLE